MAGNVPDDWGSYFYTCSRCECTYHASEGCSCRPCPACGDLHAEPIDIPDVSDEPLCEACAPPCEGCGVVEPKLTLYHGVVVCPDCKPRAMRGRL